MKTATTATPNILALDWESTATGFQSAAANVGAYPLSTPSEITIADWARSGLSAEWAAANTESYGPSRISEAIAGINDSSRSAANAQFRKTTSHYAPLDLGFTAYYGDRTLNNTSDPQIKPLTAISFTDKESGKQKLAKYLNLPKAEAAPSYPAVPQSEVADCLKRAAAFSGISYQALKLVEVNGSLNYWATIFKNPSLIGGVTEGLKKAARATQAGIPTLALRGIWMGVQKTEEGGKTRYILRPETAALAENKRCIIILFDQDEKQSTREAVEKATDSLAWAMPNLKKVSVMSWPLVIGKGFDDATASMTADEALEFAKNQASITAFSKIAAANRYAWFRKNDAADRKMPAAWIAYDGTGAGYLGDIDLSHITENTTGKIIGVDANMGAGKSRWIGDALVKPSKGEYSLCAVFTPINSLGHQIASEMGLMHISKVEGPRIMADEEIISSGGVTLCPHSLHRIRGLVRSRIMRVVIDEADAVMESLMIGTSYGAMQSQVMEDLTGLIREVLARGGDVILSQDGLKRRTLQLVADMANLAEGEMPKVIRYHRTAQKWEVASFDDINGLRSEMAEHINKGEKVAICTTSQNAAQQAEFFCQAVNPALKIIRIDSKTNRGGAFDGFFQDPDKFLSESQCDILIFSPSAKTGVSISSDYFDAVFGIFQYLDVESHLQMLGRVRVGCPRFIFVAETTQSPNEYYKGKEEAVKARHDLIFLANGRELGMPIAAVLPEGKTKNFVPLGKADQQALTSTVTAFALQAACREYASAAFTRQLLHDRLIESGHTLNAGKNDSNVKAIADQWSEARKESDKANAIAIASAVPMKTLEEAKKALARECSLEIELSAQKTLTMAKFPNVNFDIIEVVEAVLIKDRGDLGRAAVNTAKALNREAAREMDRGSWNSSIGNNIKIAGNMPKEALRAKVSEMLGILKTWAKFATEGTIYSSATPEMVQLKADCLTNSEAILAVFGFNIRANQTPVEIFHRLLRRFNLDDTAVNAGRLNKKSEKGRELVFKIDVTRVSEIQREVTAAAILGVAEELARLQFKAAELTEDQTAVLAAARAEFKRLQTGGWEEIPGFPEIPPTEGKHAPNELVCEHDGEEGEPEPE